MNKTEQKVLETLKNGFGLTSAEQEILANYIDKLQKQLDKLKEVDRQICCEELITKDKYQDILKENEELQKRVKVSQNFAKIVERDYIDKDKIRKYIKENKRVYEMKTPNRNRVIYKDCVLLTSEAKELLGE